MGKRQRTSKPKTEAESKKPRRPTGCTCVCCGEKVEGARGYWWDSHLVSRTEGLKTVTEMVDTCSVGCRKKMGYLERKTFTGDGTTDN